MRSPGSRERASTPPFGWPGRPTSRPYDGRRYSALPDVSRIEMLPTASGRSVGFVVERGPRGVDDGDHVITIYGWSSRVKVCACCAAMTTRPPLSGGTEAALTAASSPAPAEAEPGRTAGSVSGRQSRLFLCCRAILPDQGSHVSVAPFWFTVLATIPRPVRSWTRCHAGPARRHADPDGRAPGCRETTRAEELAAAHKALRLTPDHWMIPLFGDPMADGQRWVLEGRLISIALQALRLGTSVVLDYGLWGRDERSALRWLARSAGQHARWSTCPWTRTSSSPASHIARKRHRTRHSR